jgi:hypothetical protein
MSIGKISKNNKNVCLELFNINKFDKIYTPDEITTYIPSENLYNEKRVNHLLVKLPYQKFVFPSFICNELKQFLTYCYMNAIVNGIPDTPARYMYLTFDNIDVKKGESQRDSGWHIDGLQGGEVEIKQKSCFQYILFNSLPMILANQSFKTNNININNENIFNNLGKQIKKENKYTIKNNTLYFMNPYMAHKGQIAKNNQKRLFVRAYFSYLPITSVKATINPDINYDFNPHTTTGDIPSHLI